MFYNVKGPYFLARDVEALRLRGFRPQGVGTAHRRSAFWTGPPLIVDLVAVPDHYGADLGGIADGVERLATHKPWGLALRNTVAIQQLLGVFDFLRCGPMMRQHADHECLPAASVEMEK
jgi:hypothetical protein